MRVAGVAAALVAAALVAGCTVQVNGGAGSAAAASPLTSVPRQAADAPATPGAGVTAQAQSSALKMEARNMRLVRLEDQLALQFEVVNDAADAVAPSILGTDLVQRLIMLADFPRRTGYAVLDAAEGTADGRISANIDEDIEPGASATITAMFAPPPEETTTMMVMIGGLLPVEVPVERNADLVDDPVLHTGPPIEPDWDPSVAPLTCVAGAESNSPTAARRRVQLPSDVLFAFGSANLSPAADGALGALAEQVGGDGSGTVRVEGHTDAIDDDQFNQQLSEQRAAAVRDALAAKLGGGYAYEAAGAGETRPVAPNTAPDGSDDPDGRALNRRVEVTIEAAVGSTSADAVPSGSEEGTELSGSGLVPEPRSVQRVPGFVLAEVALQNSGGGDATLDFNNDAGAPTQWPGELSLIDSAGGRHEPCQFTPPAYFDYVGTQSSVFTADFSLGKVPPGATVVLWALFALPAADSSSVDVDIAGLPENVPTPVDNG